MMMRESASYGMKRRAGGDAAASIWALCRERVQDRVRTTPDLPWRRRKSS